MIKLKHQTKFFRNNLFKYYLVSTAEFPEGYYVYPTIYVWNSRFRSGKMEIIKKHRKAIDAIISHELSHLFCNYLLGRTHRFKKIDHGLSFSGFVSKRDMIVEIRVAALQEYIQFFEKDKIRKQDFIYALNKLNSHFDSYPMSKEEIKERYAKSRKFWERIGINRLQEQFHDMISLLRKST